MSSRNVIDFLAHSAPDALGYLYVPLTPSTAAQLADFTARTGVDPQTFVLDLLEDAIFDISPRPRTTTADNPAVWTGMSEVASGGVPCTEHCATESMRREKSSARSCKALHDCAVLPSGEPAKGSGPTKPPRSWPLAPNAACAPPGMNFPEIVNPPADQSLPSSPQYPSGRSEVMHE